MSLKIMQEAFLWKRFTDETIDSYVGYPNELIVDMRGGTASLRLCDGSMAGCHPISGEVSPGVTTPVITGPLEGQTEIDVSLTLSCSHFEGFNSDLIPHVHESSRWQISTDAIFLSNIVIDSGYTSSDKLSYSLSEHDQRLKHNRIYYARVSHRTTDGVVSSWSNPVSFTTRLGITDTPSQVLQINTGVYDKLGYRLALSGDGKTLVATGNYIVELNVSWDSYACIFRRTSEGWVLQKTLTSPVPLDDDRYATSGVAISYDGNTVVIADRGVNGYTGCVYVYIYTNSAWLLQATLEAPDKGSDLYFGNGVALSSDGNIIVVGEPYRNMDATNTGAGAVHYFERVGGVWSHKQVIRANEANTKNDRFGYTVALSGDGNTLITGACIDSEVANRAGAAYIFYRSNGQFAQHVKLMASDGLADDNFGFTCTISANGKKAIVGARYADPMITNSGAAYVFEKINATWVQTHKFIPGSMTAKHYSYGIALNEDGRLGLISSRGDLETAANPVDVVLNSGGAWSKIASLMIPDQLAVHAFGFSLDISDDGSVVAITASAVSDPNINIPGRVFIYE